MRLEDTKLDSRRPRFRRAQVVRFVAGLLLVLGTGIGFRISLPRLPPLISPDSNSYLAAAAILHATGFDWSSRSLPPLRTPGYPVALELLGVRTGAERSIVVWQQTLGVLTMLLVFLLAQAFSSSTLISCLCALIVGFSGQQVYYEFCLLSDALSATTFLAALALLVAAIKRTSPFLWLGLGCVLGISALVRPSNLALLPVALYFAAFPGPRLREPLFLLLGVAVLLGPWIERNRRVFGRPMLSSLDGYTLMLRAESLVDYDSPLHGPIKQILWRELNAVRNPPAEPVHMARKLIARGPGAEVELNLKMKEIAIEAIRAHPLRYLTGTAYELLALVKNYGEPVVGTGPPLVREGTRPLQHLGLWVERYWGNFFFFPALAALLISALLPLPRSYRAFAVAILVFLCSQALVVTGIERYRLTVQAGLYVVLFVTPVVIWKQRPNRRRLAIASATCAAILLTLGVTSRWEAGQRISDIGPSRYQIDAVHPFLALPWADPYLFYVQNHPSVQDR